MKVLLLKDVYKLGRAGDVKKVADGYGRNYLIPQGFAMLATPGAMKQIDVIRKKAIERRTILNNELSGVAELVQNQELSFASKAGETGKLYGSITNQMIADALNEKLETSIDRRQIEIQPIRNLGKHTAIVRLTVDLNPEIKINVYREGEAPVSQEEKNVESKAEEDSTPIVEATEEVVETVTEETEE